MNQTTQTMRIINVHDSKFIRQTVEAQAITQKLNDFKRRYPSATFKNLARAFNLSESNVSRYFYGYHAHNGRGGNYSQVRLGACVHI